MPDRDNRPNSKLSQYAASLRALSPELEQLWRALLAKTPQSFRNLATAYTAAVDVACAAAFLEARRVVEPGADQAHANLRQLKIRCRCRSFHASVCSSIEAEKPVARVLRATSGT